MDAFSMADLIATRAAAGKPYLEFLRRPGLSVGLYVLPAGAEDGQQPHGEDEVYYVDAGEATFRLDDETRPVRAGDVLFVGARRPHRFESIGADLMLLVFFAPAEGSSAGKT